MIFKNKSQNKLMLSQMVTATKINKLFLENIIILKKVKRISIFGIFILAINFKTYAKNFAVQGHTYTIYEQSFLKMIDDRLQNIDIEQEKKKLQAIVKEKVEQPKPLEIKRASKTRSYNFDPTYTLDKDIVLPCGKIAYKAGTKVNPLDHMKFDRKLIFIDARDKKQVGWLKQYLKSEKNLSHQDKNDKLIQENQIKIILTAGRPLDFEEKMQRKIYFDQAGMLTNQFKIQYVPSIIVQDGKLLKITEIEV